VIEKFKQARRGRPPKSESDRLDQRSVRLTTAQWKRLESRGGLEWLRALIDGAAPASAAGDDALWRMTPHACRVCFGRVLARRVGDCDEQIFRCASCGNEGHGDTPAVVCACGFKLEGTKDMGVRCHVNPERTPDSIDEIVATVMDEPVRLPPPERKSLSALIDGASPASAAVPASFQWALTPHICRQCFGRVLARQDGAFRCACCGEEGAGETEAVICCCGLKLEGTKDMGMRCQINEERTPEWLGEIIATALPLATPPRDHISS